jgi:hypothetical protein
MGEWWLGNYERSKQGSLGRYNNETGKYTTGRFLPDQMPKAGAADPFFLLQAGKHGVPLFQDP